METSVEKSKDSKSHDLGVLCLRVPDKVCHRHVLGFKVDIVPKFEAKELIGG